MDGQAPGLFAAHDEGHLPHPDHPLSCIKFGIQMQLQFGIAGLLCVSALAAQPIVFSFNGTLNGAPIALDSILVMNLTQEGDTTIYFPNNVLVLSAVGMEEWEQMQALPMHVQPNPFDGSADVQMEVTGGELLLTLRDATGRVLTSYAANMAAGGHRFQVSCDRPGVHLITATQGGASRTVHLIAAEGAGGASLSYTGEAGRALPKEDRSLFTWAPGDQLRYIGYASNEGVLFSDAIDEVPESSATRSFMVLSGAVCRNSPKLADVDGNEYRAVQIGDQCWMAENLRTTRYRDGAIIPHVTENMEWIQLNSPAWCNFGNYPENDVTYGKLYNWYAAANPNICPQGWHVPTDAEWTMLTDHLGGAHIAGGKMKDTGTQHWSAPNVGATNESGFSALPGGDRFANNGVFYNLGHGGFWWSSSEDGEGNAWNRLLVYFNDGVNREHSNVRDGFCVRCLMD